VATPTESAAASQGGGARRLQRAWLARGPLACALLPVAWLYGALGAMREWLYRAGIFKTVRLPVPVVVVGNLIAGGAGKTPTVMAVVKLFKSRGLTPGVISRGYGRDGDAVVDVTDSTDARTAGDEPLLMRLRLRSPVVVGRDRVAAAQELLRLHPSTDVIVSDDGLQHRRLARDAQVLVFDQRGAGNGWLLPAGPLREPMPAQVPPRSVVVYNAPQPSTKLPGLLASTQLAGAVALADWWIGRPPSQAMFDELRHMPVVAAAGMAHPERFFEMLRQTGLTVDRLPLPDHFDFTTLPWSASTTDVVITEKDAVKLAASRIGSTRVWVVPLDFRLGAELESSLLALLPPPSNRTTHGHPTS
jgi:tetraacyldisaccharide 4'-kinase